MDISLERHQENQNQMIDHLKKLVQKGGNDCLQKFDSFGGSNEESNQLLESHQSNTLSKFFNNLAEKDEEYLSSHIVSSRSNKSRFKDIMSKSFNSSMPFLRKTPNSEIRVRRNSFSDIDYQNNEFKSLAGKLKGQIVSSSIKFNNRVSQK